VPRHISTYTFVLTMFVSVARVAAWWQPMIHVGQPSPGRVRITEARGCPEYPPLPAVPEGWRFTADLRGDGCEVPITWDGTTVRFRLDPLDADTVAFAFHDEDEVPLSGRLLLGDWDCDGTDSPALYVPTTGEVVSFDDFDDFDDVDDGVGAVGEPADRSGVRQGDAQVRHGRDGCDEIEVRPAA
jgi:hypothetical protein